MFAEVCAERLSYSELISDALGNPVSVGFDDTSSFLGVGVEVQLHDSIYLAASVGYNPGDNDVFENSAIGIDGLGNPISVNEEAPDFLVRIGLAVKF